MEQKILSHKLNSEEYTDESSIVNVSLERSKKLLPNDDIATVADMLSIYSNERASSNKIRLTVQTNVIASNVLFNGKTEIVSGEGSENVIFLNTMDKCKINSLICRNTANMTYDIAMQDTQLSNMGCNFSYMCGFNIYDNHRLRNNSFKYVTSSKTTDTFNTLKDFLRNGDGTSVSSYTKNTVDEPLVKMHLYEHDDLYTFDESVTNNLKENNGWFGFYNKSQINTITSSDSTKYEFSKVINSKNACDFIEMYPDSTLFMFSPSYNKYRNRLEYNWDYCLTYPYSSVTSGFDFIESSNDSLKILYFTQNTDVTRFYSISKHNLEVGDTVNIYEKYNNEVTLAKEHLTVYSLGNDKGEYKDYIFNVKYPNGELTQKIKEITADEFNDLSGKIDDESTPDLSYTFKISQDHKIFSEYVGDTKIFENYIVERKVAIDDTVKNLSFKKVISGEEVKYYVRLLRKLPNWKFASEDINEYNIYNDSSSLLDKYGNKKYDFESHVTDMAFAKNIYGDKLSQIIFSDDIDISYLKDNIGRPLSSIYLTILKNNSGYKEWYGINSTSQTLDSSAITRSHCFGKITCAFELSKQSLVNSAYTNVLMLNNLESSTDDSYYSVSGYDNMNGNDNPDDDISYSNEKLIRFYCDLCEYSKITSQENSIQPIQFRFNTAQRELNKGKDYAYEFFSSINTTEIVYDDYDLAEWSASTIERTDRCQQREGYYYNPNYEIKINSFSNDISSDYANTISLKKIKALPADKEFQFMTQTNHHLTIYDKFVLFDKNNNIYYEGVVGDNGIINKKIFSGTLNGDFDIKYITDLKYIKILTTTDKDIPNYANLMQDGTSRYIWREFIHNGDTDSDSVETYPFANGRFYVNSNIIIPLKRQNPLLDMGNYTIGGKTVKGSISGLSKSIIYENKYTKSDDIKC